MKKILLLVVAAFIVFIGCEEVKNITLKGKKSLNAYDYEEIIYEWRQEEPNKLVKITHVYTYTDATGNKYEEKLLDCDNYKRKGSLYTCRVKKSNGILTYTEIDSRDREISKEEATEELKKAGYAIVEQ